MNNYEIILSLCFIAAIWNIYQVGKDTSLINQLQKRIREQEMLLESYRKMHQNTPPLVSRRPLKIVKNKDDNHVKH